MNKQDIQDYVSGLSAKHQQLFTQFTTGLPSLQVNSKKKFTEKELKGAMIASTFSSIETILKAEGSLLLGDEEKVQYIKETTPENLCYSLEGEFSRPMSPVTEWLLFFGLNFIMKEICDQFGVNAELVIKDMKAKDYSFLTMFTLAGCFHLMED